ncbi:MAG TPA: adenylosuccinate lyase, partial [Polyangia bacterium]
MIDRYSRKELRQLWSDQRRYDVWLDVELAACCALEREGSVPTGTTARVREKAAGKLNPARILEIE